MVAVGDPDHLGQADAALAESEHRRLLIGGVGARGAPARVEPSARAPRGAPRSAQRASRVAADMLIISSEPRWPLRAQQTAHFRRATALHNFRTHDYR